MPVEQNLENMANIGAKTVTFRHSLNFVRGENKLFSYLVLSLWQGLKVLECILVVAAPKKAKQLSALMLTNNVFVQEVLRLQILNRS